MNIHQLNQLNMDDLLAQITPESKAIEFAQSIGLIRKNLNCICGAEMRLRERLDGKNKGTYFRCSIWGCRKEVSVKKGTFFEHSHLSVRQIFILTYKFIRAEEDIESLMHETRIQSNKTIVDWLYFLKEVCMVYFINHPVTLGGVGHIVEIDECYLVKRKYNVGHLVRECWILGIHDLTLGISSFQHVLDRTQATLEHKILSTVRIGSTIFTDRHGGYNNLNDLGYDHYTVNHSANFVDPYTGASTNHIESIWQKLKQKHKEKYGTHRTNLDAHLAVFMWRQRFKKIFGYFIQHIREIYRIGN